MGSIRIEGLGKAYKQYSTRWSRMLEWVFPFKGARHRLHWVLRDIDFQVEAGESVGIIGVNGAGKSTLLKMITGTTQPTVGNIQITGRVAALLELGMGFHPDFTGRQNVLMAGQLLGLNVDEITALMSEIVEFSEIDEYIDEQVRVYSSGMQMRLAFSVATAIRPDILIIDEALAVGDVFFQQKCFERIRMYRDKGTTLLFVSHAMDSIYSLCDRAILIESGKVVLDDKPKAVIDLYNAQMIRQASANASVLQVSAQAEVGRSERVNAMTRNPTPGEKDAYVFDESKPEIGSYSSSGVDIQEVGMYVDGKKVESFISEALVTITIRVEFAANYRDPHIGFQVRNSRGEAIFMATTYGMKKILGPVRKRDVVEVDFSFVASLFEGQYTLTVGVANDGLHNGQFKESLARIQNAYAFSVLRNLDSILWAGIYNLMPNCDVRLTHPLEIG